MTLADQIKADAKAVIASEGEAITYNSDTLGTIATYAIPRAGQYQPNDLNAGRTFGNQITLAIPKEDVSSVEENVDTVDIPGEWVGESSDQTYAVATNRQTHTMPGAWIVELEVSV